MTNLRPGLPRPPPKMAKLPLDRRGYPVPKFVARINGEWDFRVIQPDWIMRCIRYNVCWLCGEKLGKNLVFVVGPMCVVNRTSGEPPCHLQCAQYAAKACPFMVNPSRPRNDKKALPEGAAINPNGLDRNPGATALYVTETYKWLAADRVIRMGSPTRIEWWAEGRNATRAEIENSINTGLPLLLEVAEKQGPHAVAELAKLTVAAMKYLPGGP